MVNNWKMWCQLCAHEGSNNFNINKFSPQSNLADALNNLFSINISGAGKWGSMICFNCHKTVEHFIEFRNKVSKVQAMFLEILNSTGTQDAKQLKTKYKLNDELDQESVEIRPIDKLYEPQIIIRNSSNDQPIDFLETSNIKIETPNENYSNEIGAEDWTSPLENDNSTKNVLKSETEVKESKEKPNEQATDKKAHTNTTAAAQCSECKKMFRSATSMRRHLKKKHGLTIRIHCEQCGKICKNQKALDEHILMHVVDLPFKCRLCDKSFKEKPKLKRHEDTHSTTSYICTICGLRLNSKATLNNHMVVHSDEKLHKCDYCGNEYKRAKALKTHLILHTGLKPYTCDFCDRTFASGANCRSHKKKAHPVELAAMEAAGQFSICTKVPELKDLRASLLSTAQMQNDSNYNFS